MKLASQPGSNKNGNGRNLRLRIRMGLLLTIIGLLIFLMGARPSFFGLERTPTVGFVQLSVLHVGLAILCIGGYVGLQSFWHNGDRTIAADLGLRLVATGFVVSAFSGMADYFGLGTRKPPLLPFFGPWQAAGIQIGMVFITLGFLLMMPFNFRKEQ